MSKLSPENAMPDSVPAGVVSFSSMAAVSSESAAARSYSVAATLLPQPPKSRLALTAIIRIAVNNSLFMVISHSLPQP